MYSASASRKSRVFATGASGYLGGNTISRLVKKHPEWDIVVLGKSSLPVCSVTKLSPRRSLGMFFSKGFTDFGFV
jgi:nucleoside-diphosphate-sugar epimerase